MPVSVLFYSVWDALTDNYISTWDSTDSEGLNANLSDHEVRVHIFLLNCMWLRTNWSVRFLVVKKKK